MTSPLALAVFGPLLLAVVALLLPRPLGARWLALLGGLLTAVVGTTALVDFAVRPGADFRLLDTFVWSEHYGATLSLGVDAISAAMLALSGVVTMLATVSAWNEARSPRTYHALVLLLLAAVNGVFAALDLLLFYVAWELVLLPMLFLIGRYGGGHRRYAAMKFFVFTLAGSVAMLALLLLLWNAIPATATKSFDLRQLAAMWQLWRDTKVFGTSLAQFGFCAVTLACLVKLPSVPLHTWLPHAHVQAPTAISVLLAGVLLKLGVYGLLRIALPLFPTAAIDWAPALGWLALGGILWGAVVALGQRDFKRLVAYASVSHMGFCLLAIGNLTPAGATAAVVQAVAHGLVSPMLFLLVGVVYDRAHHRDLDGFGGLAEVMPRYCWLLLFGALAGCGLPGLAGFVGEFAALQSSFAASAPFPTIAAIATISVVLAAAYLLAAYRAVATGPLRSDEHRAFADLDGRERLLLLPLAALVLLVGIWPRPLFMALQASCSALIQHVLGARA